MHASAPGRVNLIGEHTDYNGGFVLPTPIPQRTNVELRRRDDDLIRAWSREIGSWEEYRLGEERRRGDWLDYVMGCTFAARTAGHVLGGAELRISSDVPLGSGLASSAALEVALLRGLREAFALALDDVQLALLGQRAENDIVGAPVGAMDQLCSSLGEPGSALFIDTRSLELRHVPLPHDIDLLVIESGIFHDHASGSYRVRRAECEAAARKLGVSLLRELGPEDLALAASLPAPLNRRVRHVISENQRVLDAVAAIERGELHTLGQLFAESHASMRDDFEVSLPAIDTLVAIAMADPEVFAARLTGGGFGGSIVALAYAETGAEAARRIADRYAKQTKQTAQVLVAGPISA
ncbi:MAG TPA: galactokinase [Enhygromyxa sp.]|nr:galactokinase [Enhygromyxa sp.]